MSGPDDAHASVADPVGCCCSLPLKISLDVHGLSSQRRMTKRTGRYHVHGPWTGCRSQPSRSSWGFVDVLDE